MPPKRRGRVSPPSQGLATGQRLHRDALVGHATSPWGWVGTEASNTSEITRDHLLATCGLSDRNSHCVCRNKFTGTSRDSSPDPLAIKDTDDDVIVISDDDDEPVCSKKSCKNNPFCLNYLGQEKWEEKDGMKATFIKLADLGNNPLRDSRKTDLPVGLKNLGATCYANASLQVWFRDLAFRAGVYDCRPLDDPENRFEESPIFQLQVTFAALQKSQQSVYNPNKLIESLQLRTGEQQDAQEFSKLFMSHLDAEFKKQPNQSVKTLVNNQFEGKLLYGTVCETCRYRSERESDFLEIEVNFKNNYKLEDCIESVLATETLSGDNKYFCPQCDSLQDARREIQLTRLPPVLHFSLLRFVYDLSTMERKKSKNTILFPKRLDMNQFVGSSSERMSPDREQNIYELQGLLLHKGQSAYHGHYEAQAFDSRSQSWYQFNDELVTPIKSLGDKKYSKVDDDVEVIEVTDSNKPTGSKRKKNTTSNSRKRQRVDDSEVETPEPTPPVNASEGTSYISSKDAYMLIYARVDPEERSKNSMEIPVPPLRAMKVVDELNESHKKACESYCIKLKVVEDKFAELKLQVQETYGDWNVSSAHKDSVVTSRQALETWLSKQAMQSALPRNSDDHSDNVSNEPVVISVDDVLCEHEKLDYRKSAQMKVINRNAYDKMVEYTKCSFNHVLSSNDVCRTCVEVAFRERLYQIEHPRLVKQLNDLLENENDCVGYWISRTWLKDWCLQKPRMHKPSEDDPTPDAPEYYRHVRCEHGGLSPDTVARRRISVEARDLLITLFPTWKPLSVDEELCSICDVAHYENKSNNLRHRKHAEEEKTKLKQMYDYVFEGSMLFLDDGAYALVPMTFLRRWKQWLNKPTEAARPELIDNEQFFCEHQKLWIDPNCPSDLFSTAAIVKRAEWDVLSSLYPGGPLIAMERGPDENELESKFFFDSAVCADCRYQRKTNWETTDIIVRLSDGNTTSKEDRKPATYSRKNGARQSKRLRQVRENGEKRRLTITRSMSVKEIKIMLQEEFSIPTICQTLFYEGKELDDNSATPASLQILSNSTLELRQVREVHQLSDSEDVTVRKREEGQGFSGTVLGCGTMLAGPGPEPENKVVTNQDLKSCPACTFANPPDALTCDICDTILECTR